MVLEHLEIRALAHYQNSVTRGKRGGDEWTQEVPALSHAGFTEHTAMRDLIQLQELQAVATDAIRDTPLAVPILDQRPGWRSGEQRRIRFCNCHSWVLRLLDHSIARHLAAKR